MENNNLQSNEDHNLGSPHTPINVASPQGSPNFHNIIHNSASNSNNRSNELHRASDLLMAVSVCTEDNRTKIAELADAAMEELTKLALDGDPLWRPQQKEENESYYTLMDIMKMVEVGEPHSSLLDLEFCNTKSSENTNLGHDQDRQEQQQHFQTEFSRQIGYAKWEPLRIVGLMMDLEQWSFVFSNIVSRAAILQTWSSIGPGGNYNGTLQVMTAEFHIPTPLVSTRESYFCRFCKQVAPRTWGVVDVSLEDLFPYPSIGFCRKPSGCLIQACPDGLSKVIWVENVEVDNRWVHKMFEPYIRSGLAFGAKRWVSSLIRYCNWQATLMSKCSSTINGALIAQTGRLSVMKLAERMTKGFYSSVSASKKNPWMQIPISGGHDFRVMTQKPKENDLGRPPCTSVVFSTSIQIPTNPKHVFHFLRHEKARNKWDILSYGYLIREICCIINGLDSRNRVSIIQVDSAPKRVEIFYLQESFYDASGSYIVFAPVDVFTMSVVLRGGNPDTVAILPSGFSILPDQPRMNGDEVESDGSILTIGLNIIDHSVTERIPFDSMVSMHRIMSETIASIKGAFKTQQN